MRRAVCVLVLLLLATVPGRAQQQVTTRIISGQVTDANTGQPIAGARISLRGQTVAAVTGEDGNFNMGVPVGLAEIRIRAIGYKRVELRVPDTQSTVTAALEVDILNLEEVVVTGQATGMDRRNLPNAVATVSAEDLNRAPSASIEQALQGRVAGANIQANSGAPGGGMQIQLRGTSSIIGEHKPLYIVDGVIVSNDALASNVHVVTVSSGNAVRGGDQDNAPNRIADLNPNDIESIEILKGASASAIYGSKATNGVIIITTKRGRVGRPQFDFSQRFGTFQKSNDLGLRRFADEASAVDAFGPNASNFYSQGAFFDHEENLAGNSPLSFETSLGVNGGTDDTRYFASALIKHDGGIVTGTEYDKQSLKLNIDQSIGSRVSFGLSTTAVHTNTDRGFTNNDNRSISYWMTLPSTPSFIDLRQNADGTWPTNPFASSNILETAAKITNEEDVNRFIGSANLSWNAITTGTQELRFGVTGGVDYFNQAATVYSPGDLQYEPLDGLPGTSVKGDAASRNLNVNTNGVHQYFGNSFTATTSVGFQYEERELNISRIVGKNLVPGLTNADDGTDVSVLQTRSGVKDFGFFAQEELLIGDKLLLTGAIRVDQSSNNADTEKLHTYPKAAASYRFPDLNFGPLNELKLRVAYGQSGNQPLYGQKFSTLNTGNIGGLQTFSVSTTTVSPNLQPERQREIEGGFDATLFNDRANLEFTVYEKKITDLLLQRSLAPSTGFNTQIFNGGVLRTRGAEAGLTMVPILTNTLQWTSSATFTLTRSTVVELPVPEFAAGGFGTALGGFRIREGTSPSAFFGRDTAIVADDPRCEGTCAVGDRIITVLGDAQPDFRMGFSNELSVGSFNFYTLFDWQQGGTIANLTGWLYDLSKNAEDYANPCTHASCQGGETLGDFRLRVYPGLVTDVWLEDASFLKLREATLSVNLPQSFVNNLWSTARYVRLSFSGRNLITWSGYSGMDPEVSNFGSEAIARNLDVAPFPPSRSFWFSVDFGF